MIKPICLIKFTRALGELTDAVIFCRLIRHICVCRMYINRWTCRCKIMCHI